MRNTLAALPLVVLVCLACRSSTMLPLLKPELLLTPTSMSSVRLAASADGGRLVAGDGPLQTNSFNGSY